MNDVERRDLIVLLAEDKENGVQEFDELAEIEDPSDADHSHGVRVIRFVDRLTLVVILAEPAVDPKEPKQISIQ